MQIAGSSSNNNNNKTLLAGAGCGRDPFTPFVLFRADGHFVSLLVGSFLTYFNMDLELFSLKMNFCRQRLPVRKREFSRKQEAMGSVPPDMLPFHAFICSIHPFSFCHSLSHTQGFLEPLPAAKHCAPPRSTLIVVILFWDNDFRLKVHICRFPIANSNLDATQSSKFFVSIPMCTLKPHLHNIPVRENI